MKPQNCKPTCKLCHGSGLVRWRDTADGEVREVECPMIERRIELKTHQMEGRRIFAHVKHGK